MSKGVCTSPNGVMRCQSPTCPGANIVSNLKSYRFYAEGSEDEALKNPMFEYELESLEANMEHLMDCIAEDVAELTAEEQQQVIGSLSEKEKAAFYDTLEGKIISGKAPVFDSEEMDKLFDSYKYAALWSSVDEEGNQLSSKYTIEDFDKASSAKERASLNKFISENASLILAAQNRLYGDELDGIANDFLFTRNGEGVGFWDRTELKENQIGERLSVAASKYRSVNAVVGDDNKIYFE